MDSRYYRSIMLLLYLATLNLLNMKSVLSIWANYAVSQFRRAPNDNPAPSRAKWLRLQPNKAIFGWDISLFIGLNYLDGTHCRYLQFRYPKVPFIFWMLSEFTCTCVIPELMWVGMNRTPQKEFRTVVMVWRRNHQKIYIWFMCVSGCWILLLTTDARGDNVPWRNFGKHKPWHSTRTISFA